MPFILLVFLFIGVPIAEITLLIKVGGTIGLFNTIGFVILTAILGAYLVRQQGLETVHKLQVETNAGRIPAMQIAEGVALLFAGAVLMTPGFITDAIGFAILIPPIRQAAIAWSAKHLMNGQIHTSHSHTPPTNNQRVDTGEIIEGEYTSHKDESN